MPHLTCMSPITVCAVAPRDRYPPPAVSLPSLALVAFRLGLQLRL